MENINNPYKYFNKASQLILNSLHEKPKEKEWEKAMSEISKEEKEHKGNMNCPYCHGTGTCYEPDGEDDVNAEVCDCSFN